MGSGGSSCTSQKHYIHVIPVHPVPREGHPAEMRAVEVEAFPTISRSMSTSRRPATTGR